MNGEYIVGLNKAILYCDTKEKSDAMIEYFCQKRANWFVFPQNTDNLNENLSYAFYNTSYFHEGRHIHDYLTAPGLRIQLIDRILEALCVCSAELTSNNTDKTVITTLPIPFYKWLKLEQSKRFKYLTEWNHLDNYHHIVPQWYFEKNTLISSNSIYDKIIKDYNSTGKNPDLCWLVIAANCRDHYLFYEKQHTIFRNGLSISTHEIIETSALLSQIAFIIKIYGYQDAGSIIEYYLGNTIAQGRLDDYTNVFSVFINYLYEKRYPTDAITATTFLSAAVTWSLWGLPCDEMDLYYPCERFKLFIEKDLMNGITVENYYKNPLEIFNYWNNKINAPNPDYNWLIETTQRNFECLMESYPASNLFKEYLDMLLCSIKYQHRFFLANPKAFLVPEEYMWQFYRHVNVPLDVNFSYNSKEYFDIWQTFEKMDKSYTEKSFENQNIFRLVSDVPYIDISPLRNDQILPIKESVIQENECFEQYSLFFLESNIINGEDNWIVSFYNNFKKQSLLSKRYKIKFVI